MGGGFESSRSLSLTLLLSPQPILRTTASTYFCTNSDPITLMNVASVRLATARAHRVLPVPGGPYSKTPFGGSIPKFTKRSGYNNNNFLKKVKSNLSLRLVSNRRSSLFSVPGAGAVQQLHAIFQSVPCNHPHHYR